MNPIDQNRLLQMRSAIVAQNQALQRAAGLDTAPPASTSFTQTLSDAVRAVDVQQSKASDLSAAYGVGMEAREEAYQARLEKQYATLDAKLSAFKATQSYLEQQIKLWSNEK